jgi:hypothetical protein
MNKQTYRGFTGADVAAAPEIPATRVNGVPGTGVNGFDLAALGETSRQIPDRLQVLNNTGGVVTISSRTADDVNVPIPLAGATTEIELPGPKYILTVGTTNNANLVFLPIWNVR